MHSDDMVICFLNVRDLSNNTKRRETFFMVKEKKKFNFLQEVHSTNETEPYWHSEWGYSTIFTTFSSSRAGVAISSVQQQFPISNSETFCRPRRRSNLVINAVSVKKARKLFCTSFGNFLSLNPFGMKLLVIGWKTALAFLTKYSLFRLT